MKMSSILHQLLAFIILLQVSTSSPINDRYNEISTYTGPVSKRIFGSARPNNQLSFKSVPASDTLVTLHQNAELTCSAKGSPPPTIHWLFNGTRIPQGITNDVLDDEAVYEQASSINSQAQMGVTQTRLFIDCVRPQDLGQYTCVADSPRDRIVKDTQVKMDPERFMTSDSCLVKKALHGVPARIYMWTDIRVGIQNTAVQLFCRADGFPRPTITWYEENSLIDTFNQDYELLPSGDLLVKRLMHHHVLFRYRCKAENTLGVSEMKVGIYAVANPRN